MTTRPQTTANNASDPLRRRRLPSAGRFAAIGIAAALAITFSVHRSPRALMSDLIVAAETADERVIEGRLDGIWDYPYRKVARSAARPTSRTLHIRATAAEVLERVDANTEVRGDDLRAVAVASIITGRPDQALALLGEHVQHDSSTAEEWNTVAAAHLEIGGREDDARSYARALCAADAALERSPGSPIGRYNRLIALEGLGLWSSAERAAHAYLEVDGGSIWATEVRQRLQRLSQPTTAERWKSASKELGSAARAGDSATVAAIVRQFPEKSRVSAEGEFLGQWAEALLDGKTQAADQALSLARAVGESLYSINGEGLLRESVNRIDTMPATGKAIAQAHIIYKKGRVLYASRKDNAGSAALLAQARRLFDDHNSPMALVSSYYEAQALLDLHQDTESASALEYVFRGLRPDFVALRAQAQWQQQRLLNRSGRQYEALHSAQQSHALFKKLGEETSASKVAAILATSLMLVGRIDEGWHMRTESFRGGMESGEASVIDPAINTAAREQVRQSEFDVARSLFDVLLERPVGDRVRADAILWRTLSDAQIKNETPDLTAAAESARIIADPAQRSDADDEILFVTGRLERDNDPSAAVHTLTRVLMSKVKKHQLVLLPSIYLERARAYKTARHSDEALIDLEAATRLLEERGSGIPELVVQDAFFGRSADAFSELIDLLVTIGRFEDAFDVADRERALSERSAQPRTTFEEVRKTLHGGSVVAHLTTLPERTLLVVCDERSCNPIVIPAGRTRIKKLRDEFLNAISLNDRTLQRQRGRELYDLLLKPTGEPDREFKSLMVIPDSVLLTVPFGALVLPSGSSLIEKRNVSLAPSARVLVRDAGGPTFELRTAAAVALTDPAFDAKLFPQLSRLPSARTELSEFVKVFPEGTVYDGQDATKRVAIQALRTAGLVHIAAHVLVNDRDAALSLIAFAPEPGDAGSLYMREIVGAHVQSRIVVLAGCGTASRGGTVGHLGSFASALISSGARNVVATYWDVDDTVSSAFARRYYRRLVAGSRPAEAMRGVQLDMIRSNNPEERTVRAWGAWTLFATGE